MGSGPMTSHYGIDPSVSRGRSFYRSTWHDQCVDMSTRDEPCVTYP
jgi:hypothetical protein